MQPLNRADAPDKQISCPDIRILTSRVSYPQVLCRNTNNKEEAKMSLAQLQQQEAAFFSGHPELRARSADMGSVALADRLDTIQRDLLTKTDIISTLIDKVRSHKNMAHNKCCINCA